MPRVIEDKKRRTISIVIGVSSLIFFASIIELPAENKSKQYAERSLALGSFNGLEHDVVYVVKRYIWMGNRMAAVVSPRSLERRGEAEEIWTLNPDVTALSLGTRFRLSRENPSPGEVIQVLHRDT